MKQNILKKSFRLSAIMPCEMFFIEFMCSLPIEPEEQWSNKSYLPTKFNTKTTSCVCVLYTVVK